MRMLMVPAAPPSMRSADGVLCTLSCENSSDGNMSRSTSRFWLALSWPVDAMATGALLSNTRVKLVFRPRMATLRPSPVISREMVMPGMRLNDSARFVSGNLPMSSVKIESTKPTELRLASVDSVQAAAEAGDHDLLDFLAGQSWRAALASCA